MPFYISKLIYILSYFIFLSPISYFSISRKNKPQKIMSQVREFTQLTCTPTVLIGSRKAFSEWRLVICISFSWSSSVVQALTLCNSVCGWKKGTFFKILRNEVYTLLWIIITALHIYIYWIIAIDPIWYFSLYVLCSISTISFLNAWAMKS